MRGSTLLEPAPDPRHVQLRQAYLHQRASLSLMVPNIRFCTMRVARWRCAYARLRESGSADLIMK